MSIKKNMNCQALTGRAGSSHFCEMEPTSNAYFTFKYMHQPEILKGNLQLSVPEVVLPFSLQTS